MGLGSLQRQHRGRALAATATALAVWLSAFAASAGGVAVGEAAPAFSLAGTDGRTYTLEGLLAEHGGLVVAWFPKAFTPG